MNSIKKYIIASILLIGASLFAGCADLVIEASIDENNTLTYSYDIDISDIYKNDINYIPASSYLRDILIHWDKNGYDAELTQRDDGLNLNMVVVEEYETREEAFAALYKHMTSEISPFGDVSYGYNLDYYGEEYYIDATLDFSGIVDDDIYDVYPDMVGKYVDDVLQNTTVTVNFSFPINESIEEDVISQYDKSFNVPIDEEASINISGVINNNANRIYEEQLIAKRKREERTMIITFSIGFVLLLALVVLIIIRIIKKKKNNSKEAIGEYGQAKDKDN